MMNSPTLWTVVIRSLRYFIRTHATIAVGIAAATAVIVGALVVGDSVRASLRALVVDRLANVECLLHTRTFFSRSTLASLDEAAQAAQVEILPTIFLASGSAENRSNDQLLRATQIQVLAVAEDFWSKVTVEESLQIPRVMNEDEIVLNRALADELSVAVGDELSLRFQGATGVPADNPLGSREDDSISLPRQKVIAILPDQSIGGLGFRSSQEVPRNIFCNVSTMQDVLDMDDEFNAALVLTDREATEITPRGDELCQLLNPLLQPKLEDYGLQFEHHRRVFPDKEIDGNQAEIASQEAQTVYDYYQLTSRELIIDNPTASAIVQRIGLDKSTRLISYLANTIARVVPRSMYFDRMRRTETEDVESGPPTGEGPRAGDFDERRFNSFNDERNSPVLQVLEDGTQLLSREIPYSIVTGVDAGGELNFADFTDVPAFELREASCWINSWLAEELSAQPGDWIRLSFYDPETVDGQEVELSTRLKIAGIVPITEPATAYVRDRPARYSTRPTLFNDPNLTPTVPGLTDKDSIANWDAPFKLKTELILDVDDKYYANYRLTPKLFASYGYLSSYEFFGSRFGQTTAIRFSAEHFEDEKLLRHEIEQALLGQREDRGFVFQPVRAEQLRAASGTTPFDMLFLSLSFFVIVAALLLVTLLFKLGIQQRTSQLGVLAAQGFTPSRIRGIVLRELMVVAAIGAALGIFMGLAYARLMIAGLESWWIGAISSAFLEFSFTWRSLAIGALAGMLASLTTIYWGLRSLSRRTPLALLRGQTGSESGPFKKINRVWLAVAGFLAFGAVALIVAGLGQSGMARAGSFFGSGMMLLAAALMAIWQLLGSEVWHLRQSNSRGSLWTLAARAISRNPARSSLSLGLLAVASFLIASMGVFRVSATSQGYGGFNLLAESSLPVYKNISSGSIRSEIIGGEADKLIDTNIVSMRMRRGEDASCNNLFQVSEPTVLGVPQRLARMHELSPESVSFSWAASPHAANPWTVLERPATGEADSPIPVILDQNTAAWSLKQGASLNAITQLTYGDRVVYFRTAGLLSNSVLQGKLLISEANFQALFPELSGYSFFMIQTGGKQDPQMVSEVLEKGWSDAGMDVQSSQAILARLLGVQNTYISAFQSLGALGLLLGTFGLVAVQLRSVLERRRELALMQAVGFSQARMARMLTLETAMLLLGGMFIGVATAAIALVAYIFEVGPQLSIFNPVLMLGLVLAAGFIAALLAVRAAARQALLPNLRSE